MGERSDERAGEPGPNGGRAEHDRAGQGHRHRSRVRRAAAAAVLCLLLPLLPLTTGTASAAGDDAVPEDSQEIPYAIVQDGVHWGAEFLDTHWWRWFTPCSVTMWAQLNLSGFVTPREDGSYEIYHERIWTPTWSDDEIRQFDRIVMEADGRYQLGYYGGAMWDVDGDGVDDHLADGGDVDCLASDIAAVTGYPYASEHRFYTLTEVELLANFDYEVTNPSTGEVSFTSTSVEPTGSDVTYLWDFDDRDPETGDDFTSTEQNPVHTFSEPGTYYVNLEVTDEEGNKDDWSREVEVKAPELTPRLRILGADEGEGPVELPVGQEATLELELAAGQGLGNLVDVEPNGIAPVQLPDGIELVSGPTELRGLTFEPGSTKTYAFVIQATEAGSDVITTEWFGDDASGRQFDTVGAELAYEASSPGLDVDLEVAPGTVTVGDPATVTMTVTNQLEAENVIDVSAVLEAAWEPAEIDGAEPEISVLSPDAVALLEPGESRELTATVTGASLGTLTLTGEADGTQADSGTPIEGSAEAELTIGEPPLDVEIAAEPDRTTPGEEVELTITVTNTSDAEITDVFGQVDVEWEAATDSEDEPAIGDLSPEEVSSLPAGGSVELTATLTAPGPGTATVTSTATGTDSDGDEASSDEAEVEVTVVGELIVNSDEDAADEDVEDGACDTGGTVTVDGDEVAECTLRAAIEEANARGDGAEITFDIDGAGVPKITPAGSLPALSGPSTLDGTTQAGGKVELSGGDGDGLVLDGSAVEVRGLVVTGFAGAGIVLGGDGGHTVGGSWIGVGTDGSSAAGNAEAGIRVESPGNTIGGSAADENVMANNGDQDLPEEPEPGTEADDVEADAADLTANVVFGDGGGGTVSHNDLGAGVGVVALGATLATTVEENDITSKVGVVAVASNPSAAGVTVAGNTFGEGTVVGVVVAGGGATSSHVTENTFEGVGVPVLAAGVPDSAPLGVQGNETSDASLGILMLGVAGATVDGNKIHGALGVMSAGDASSSLGHNTFADNTFTTDVGLILAGENADEVSANRFEGDLGALYVATSEVVTSGNTFDSDVGVVSIGPGQPGFGHNRYESNHLKGEMGLILAGEDGHELEGNTFTDNELALLMSTSQASKLTGNTISGGTIGMALINVGGAEIKGNSVTGTKLGVIVVAGEPTDAEKAQADAQDAPTDSEDIFAAAFDGSAGDAALAWANAGQDLVEVDHTTIYRSAVSGARNLWTGNTISGNVLGMLVGGEVNANEIGGASPASANTITGNSAVGLLLAGAPGPQDVTIRGNVIHGNGTSGHEEIPAGIPDLKLVPGVSETPDPSSFAPLVNDLGDGDSGPNGLQNHPVLTRVAADGSAVAGELRSSSGTFIVDLYATSSCHSSGHGGAHRYLGEVTLTVDGSGRGTFEAPVSLTAGEVVTATATPTGAFADGGTSEFSRCAAIGQAGTTSTEGAEAGDDRIEVGEDHDVEIGDDVIINPGGANEETANVTGYGSLIFAEPLKFAHAPGEPIVVVADDPPVPPGPGGPTGPSGPSQPEPGGPAGCVGTDAASAGFSDVAGGSTHAAPIDCLASLGIVDGRPDGTFGPARPVTRGQFASLLDRLAAHLGAELPSDAPDAFDDDAEPHEDSLNRLAAVGVIHGTSDRRANPGAPITRAQAATMIHRLWPLVTGEPMAPGGDSFDDDDGTVHEAAIDALAAAGIVNGTSERQFSPSTPTRRDEAATLLTRVLTIATA